MRRETTVRFGVSQNAVIQVHRSRTLEGYVLPNGRIFAQRRVGGESHNVHNIDMLCNEEYP